MNIVSFCQKKNTYIDHKKKILRQKRLFLSAGKSSKNTNTTGSMQDDKTSFSHGFTSPLLWTT